MYTVLMSKLFSLIEMLVAMMVISITLLIVPDLIRLSKTFLIESRELTTVDFEFFSRDILEDFRGVDRNDIEISNSVSFYIKVKK